MDRFAGTFRAAFGLLAALSIAAGVARADWSAKDKWLKPTARTWSREALLPALLGQTKLKTRDQVISLFGAPDLARRYFLAKQGMDGEVDQYRLSAANNKLLQFDTRADGGLTGPTVEDQGCACRSCQKAKHSPAAALTAETVSRYLSSLKDEANAHVPLAAVERALGHPGVRTASKTFVGGQDWAGMEVAWPVADDLHRFLVVWGNVPFRDRPKDDVMPMVYFTDVVVSDLCLAQ